MSNGTNGSGRIGRSPAAWLRGSIQARFVVTVCVASALLLTALEVLQLIGLPATGIQGRLSSLRSEASRLLSLAADERKEKVLATLVELRKDVEILAGEDTVRWSTTTLCRAVAQQGLGHTGPSPAWDVLTSRDDYRALDRAFRRVQEISGAYEAIHIVDLASSRVCFSTDAALLGTDKSSQRYFQVASRLAGGYVSETGVAAYAPVPVSRACCLIRDSSGAPVALLALVVNMDLVIRPLLVTGPELGDTAEAVLVNDQATILTTLAHPLRDGSIAQPFGYHLDSVPARMAARGEEGLVESLDYRGTPVLAAVRHIRLTQDWGWGLVVKIDQAELFAPAAADARRALALSSADVLLLSLLVFFLMRRIARPVQALAGVAKRFADGDRSSRSGIRGPDEVGTLAKAFDSMADAIHAGWNALEERNTELVSLTEALAVRERLREGLLAISAAAASSTTIEELQAQTEELRQSAEEIGVQRQQVMEADRLKSEFLSNMSHELRTPLNSILALSQLMLARGPGTSPEVDRQHLAIVERNGRQLLDLINNILDLSKIEAGRMDVERLEFEVGSVLADVEETIAPLAREKGLDLRVDAARAGKMHTDPEKLRQVLLNILGNAVKFTDRGSVRLTVSEEDAQLRFVVDDTGIGIPADELPRIFDEFRQVDGSTTRRHGGTGLGLAISRRLARLLGGDITARSTEGEGSTFAVTLPRSLPRSPASADRPASAGERRGSRPPSPTSCRRDTRRLPHESSWWTTTRWRPTRSVPSSPTAASTWRSRKEAPPPSRRWGASSLTESCSTS